MRSAAVLLVSFAAMAGCKEPAPSGASVAPSAASLAPVASSASTGASASASAIAPPDLSRKGTIVVHIGDSFTEAYFEQNLRARFAGVGAKYIVRAQTPSYTPVWAYGGYDGGLDTLLYQHPALVLVTLGANEVEMKVPEQHAKAVRELARKASQWGQCVWITPPMWKKDTGFLDVVRDNCAPCAYFRSDDHVKDVERQRDGIHPNEAGGARWAAAFWEWLEAHRVPAKGWTLSE